MKLKTTILVIAVSFLVGCATSYGPSSKSLAGGWRVKHMEGDIYRVVFGSNGYTTRETTQTYWLYRASELAIEKGFDGFEILSNITLTKQFTPEDYFLGESEKQKHVQYYVPIYIDDSYKPLIEADIKLLNMPFEHSPPRVFDAKVLKEALEKHVMGEKCSMSNVCEHVHHYIHRPKKTEI